MTALLSAPWYFLAGFAFFGLVLVAVACWAVVNWALDYLAKHEDAPAPPEHFCANETRIPKE